MARFARASGPARSRSSTRLRRKLGYWRPEAPSDKEEDAQAVRKRFEALQDTRRDVITDASKPVLALGALGVVYGDIGTSPLYTEQVISPPTEPPRMRRRLVSTGRLADLLGPDDHRLNQLRGLHHRAPTVGRRHHGAGLPPPASPGHLAATLLTLGLRRGAALRRRDHHARDLGPRLG